MPRSKGSVPMPRPGREVVQARSVGPPRTVFGRVPCAWASG
ncbi:MAG: hypothetical protein AVDCRST_MAG89-368 [uncultured Gemmatimonadetes bacterium]|uniref:Uncharacterized protein n=1 Tax=uncultured Gemmatimonadota bacterium TaxID=203437 RepID=A0A6J4K9G8_9BACT|nr:MAG: hypothetical protein AVDCRST_MAG89-368 [uncultured Gemmatimonadota bacterium]